MKFRPMQRGQRREQQGGEECEGVVLVCFMGFDSMQMVHGSDARLLESGDRDTGC